MEDKEYKITTVIPAYNNEHDVARAIESVLAQTHPVDEIIVVDDGSTDKTADIIKNYEGNVQYIQQENAGVSVARNTGIHAAAGDWIAFLDADDEWLPDKIKIQTNILARNPDLVWISSNYFCQDETTSRRQLETEISYIEQYMNDRDDIDYFKAYCHRVWGHTSNYMIRKSVLVEAGLFEPGLNLLEDMDLWWKIAYRYPRLGFSSEPLSCYHYTVKPHGLTRLHRPVENYIKIVDRHLALSREHHSFEAFQQTMSILLQAWIRRMLFENRPKDVRLLLDRYPELMSKRFYFLMRILTIAPKLTLYGCRFLSYVSRKMKIRKRLVARPPSTEQSRCE